MKIHISRLLTVETKKKNQTRYTSEGGTEQILITDDNEISTK